MDGSRKERRTAATARGGGRRGGSTFSLVRGRLLLLAVSSAHTWPLCPACLCQEEEEGGGAERRWRGERKKMNTGEEGGGREEEGNRKPEGQGIELGRSSTVRGRGNL
eukprot:755009-Hanusia_phi.AAC.1